MAYPRRFAYGVIAALTLGGTVHAQVSKADEARATELKKQGDELVHASKFQEALKAYDESFKIVPNPAIWYNRSRAFQALEQFPEALEALEKFEDTAPVELKAKVPSLDNMMADIAGHVATLVINCPIEGASVTVGDKTIGTTPLKPYRTTPGDVAIVVNAPGYTAFNETATLKGGESATVDVTLKKLSNETPTLKVEEPPPDQVAVTPEKPPPSSGSGWRTAGFVSGSIGLVSLGAGMVLLGLAVSEKGSADPHCPNKVCDATGWQSLSQAQTFATVSTVLVVGGAVFLGVSLISFIAAPKSHSPVSARLYVGPGSASLGGTF